MYEPISYATNSDASSWDMPAKDFAAAIAAGGSLTLDEAVALGRELV
jgi:hypothetical protein